MPLLIGVEGSATPREFKLRKLPVSMGHQKGCHIQLTPAQAALSEIRLVEREGRFRLVDERATGRLTINHVPCKDAPIAHGDGFSLGGSLEFLFLESTDNDAARRFVARVRTSPEFGPAHRAFRAALDRAGLGRIAEASAGLDDLLSAFHALSAASDTDQVVSVLSPTLERATGASRLELMLARPDAGPDEPMIRVTPGGGRPPADMSLLASVAQAAAAQGGLDDQGIYGNVQLRERLGDTYLDREILVFAIPSSDEESGSPSNGTGGPRGAVWIERPRGAAVLSPPALDRVRLLLLQAGTALERAARYDSLAGRVAQLEGQAQAQSDKQTGLVMGRGKLERRVRELEGLYEMACAWQGATNYEAVQQRLVARTSSMLAASHVALMLVGPDGSLALAASQPAGPGGTLTPGCATSLARLHRSSRPSFVDDAARVQLATEIFGLQTCRDVVAAPLVEGSKKIGLVIVGWKEGVSAERTVLIDKMTAAARQLAQTLHDARSFHWAVADPQTGLAVEAYFRLQVDRELKRARRHPMALSLVLVGLEQAETLLADRGPALFEQTLQAMARQVRASARNTDVLGRMDPGLFALLLVDTDRKGARIMAERLCVRLEDDVARLLGPSRTPRVIAGVGACPARQPVDPAELFALAFKALEPSNRWTAA